MVLRIHIYFFGAQLLKKELDSLRSEVQRTEGITKVAKKKHYDECEKLKELQAQFRDADNCRQEAYARLQELKKQSYEKVILFFVSSIGSLLRFDWYCHFLLKFVLKVLLSCHYE